MTASAKTPKIHPFEEAGLGLAPFRYVGCYEDRGPHRFVDPKTGCEMTVGSPGQPMGSCDFCGQGIAICCRIESADGKSFVVGTDCVLKTTKPAAATDVDRAHARLIKEVRRDINARQRAARHAREAKQLSEAEAWLNANQAALEALPNPNREGETLWDQVLWYRDHAGTRGNLGLYQGLRRKLEG